MKRAFAFRRRSYTWFLSTLLAAIALTGTYAGSVPAAHGAAKTSSAANSTITRGTVVSVRPLSGAVMVVVRKAGKGGLAILLVKGSQVKSRDGHALDASAIRPGDIIMRNALGHIIDMSQRMTHVAGIVAYSPQGDISTLVVNLSPTHEIMVDVSPGTAVTDTNSQGNTAPMNAHLLGESVADSDTVRIGGMMDDGVGEMTQTVSVAVVEPKRSSGHKH